MKDRVLLVGSYPPPYGGCSVHTLRLREALRDKFSVEVIDLYGDKAYGDDRSIVRCGRRRPLNAIFAILSLLRQPARLAHFHAAGMDAFLFAAYPMLAVLRRETRRVLTIHSGSFVNRFRRGPVWRRLVLRNLLRRFDRIITVNQEQQDFLAQIGIEKHRVTVIPAFLPPVARESLRSRTAIKKIADCDSIILCSGYGQPHYGFHIVVDALELLRLEGYRFGLLLCLYNSFDELYVAGLEEHFKNGLSGAVIRDLSPEEFAWLLERCDTYIRATDRDGDAVAIREAQFFGKRVIASDCVERPSHVRLFETNNAASLAKAVMEKTEADSFLSRADECASLTALLDVYNKVLTA